MSLASLFNIPQDEIDWLHFSFHNMDQHRLIVRRIFSQKNVSLPTYDLDPIRLDEPDGFFRLHQQAHADFTGALGIAGVDLTDVDFRDSEQVAAWIRLHGEEHRLAANMLGFG